MTRKWLRWVPAVAVPAVIAGGVLVGSLPASAGDPLPAKTPQQVLLMIAEHQENSLSGTLEQSSELGLPQLPKSGPEAGSPDMAWLELLTGPPTPSFPPPPNSTGPRREPCGHRRSSPARCWPSSTRPRR